MSSRIIGTTGLLILLFSGCALEAEPRPELVVMIDTDLPVVDQLRTHPELSNDAAMDTVRIDILDANDVPFDFIVVTAADPLDWPVSFGVATAGKERVRLRARVFRAQHAVQGELMGVQTLEPLPGAVIDRIIDVPLPATAVTKVEVVLRGDCLGVKPSFAAPSRSCLDGAHLDAPSSDGIATPSGDAPIRSRVGTWAPAREVPCSKPGDSERVCIPGGFTLLGDDGLTGFADGIKIAVDSAPLRPVLLSPFYLDRTEVTVGTFDALRASRPNALTGTLPLIRDPASATTNECTWLGGAGGAERYPLNCIARKTAAELCAARGGRLPSEAQWEHAARGRGQRRPYPWGVDYTSACCVAALQCANIGIEPVGSHPRGRSVCGGFGDVSRDGVLDMGGSLSEVTADALAAYDDPCWSVPGILVDPVCITPGATRSVRRGASWKNRPHYALAALRQLHLDPVMLPGVGVRCAYVDGTP